MVWHIIEGEEGCLYAAANGCVAVVVDALRASATAAALLAGGATELIAVREVSEARAAKAAYPDALLFGERGGLPPEGFDYGNSPRDASAASGRRVVFTTTTGAGRLLEAWGAQVVCMGTTVNASAVAAYAAGHGQDVVLIPAGLAGDPHFDAQEDWVAATVIAMRAGAPIRRGAEPFAVWRARIEAHGVDALFQSAPHAGKLRKVGLGDDIAFCAQLDVVAAVPYAAARNEFGVIVRNATAVAPHRGAQS